MTAVPDDSSGPDRTETETRRRHAPDGCAGGNMITSHRTANALMACRRPAHGKRTLFGAAALLSSAAVLAPVAAFAQSEVIEEVVVTAQRRSENLQEIPVAVTALSGEALVRNNVRTIEDLSAKVPGFVSSTGASYGIAPLALRGISGAAAGGNAFADEPVGTYMNGVALTATPGTINNLLDISQIEVLRGPQGTLFGKAATAGTIQIATRKPMFGVREGFAQGEISTLGDHKVAAGASFDVVDERLAVRLVAALSERDGYATNVRNGKGLGGGSQAQFRTTALWLPAESVTSTLVFNVDVIETRPVTIALADLRNLANVNPYVTRPDLKAAIESDDLNYDTDPQSNITTIFSSWVNTVDLGWGQLTSTTGYIHSLLRGEEESDSIEVPLNSNYGQNHVENFSQEFVLTGKADRLNWTTGVYLAANTTRIHPIVSVSHYSTNGLGQLVTFESKQVNSNYGVFFDGTYELTPRLSVTAGLRYGEDSKNFHNDVLITTIRSGRDALNFGFRQVPANRVGLPAGAVLADPPAVKARKSFVNFSPRAVVQYEFAPTIFGYASVSRGFKSGGFDALGVPASTLVPHFKNEEITSYEAGLKSELFERRLLLNLAAYHYDYKDLQVRVSVPTGGVLIQNAADATVNGLDIETVLRATDQLKFTATASFMDAEFDRGVVSAPAPGVYRYGSTIPLVPIDISGHRLVRAPKVQLFGRADYTWTFGDYQLTADAAVRYQSKVYFLETIQDSDNFSQDGWTQVDLRATLRPASGDWEASAYVVNVGDVRYLTQVSQTQSFPRGVPNEPRRFGMQVKRTF